MEVIKLTDVSFLGFSREERDRIREHMGVSNAAELSFDFVQSVADIVGCDVATMIVPFAPIALIKLGG